MRRRVKALLALALLAAGVLTELLDRSPALDDLGLVAVVAALAALAITIPPALAEPRVDRDADAAAPERRRQ